MIYFDNAATTFPKPKRVINELNDCIINYCGNPGRSAHALSLKSSEKIFSTREMVCELLNVDSPESIVFTQNATHALNIAIKSLIPDYCHVLTSDFEHNSVIRPLERLKENGVNYSLFNTEGDVERNILSKITPHTRAIVSSICSNVTGKNINITTLSKIARKNNLFLIIDASQAVGHVPLDLKANPCDALCAPGHKALFGIQGSGFAYFRDTSRKNTIMEGGSGTESLSPYMPSLLPEGYEAGTLSTPSIVSLKAGIEFISHIGISNIENHLAKLSEECVERLHSIKEVVIHSFGNGIVLFNIKKFPSAEAASILDKYGICARGGLHCAPSAHRKIGTLENGAVRVSFSCFNDAKELDILYKAVKDIANSH